MNARTPIKPKTIRLSILCALASGEITTLDSLLIAVEEPRNKLVSNLQAAVAEGLVRRLRDDTTRQPAYQITADGKQHIDKYSDGRTPEPAPAPVSGECPDSAVIAAATVPPRIKEIETAAKNAISKDAEIAELHRTLDVMGKANAAIIDAANASGELPMGCPVTQIEALTKSRNLFRTKARELEKRISDHEDTAKQLLHWLSMARTFGCTTPEQIADRISRIAESTNVQIVGHVIERPAKVLTRVRKFDHAKKRALALARKDGKKAQLFGMVLLGVAQPGAEWREI